jgi:His-Xaa-Ser system radical SAM maturase HxsB
VTTIWPLRFRESGDDFILTDEAGGWSVGSPALLDRYVHDRLTTSDLSFFAEAGHAFENVSDLAYSSFIRRWANRHAAPAGQIGYVILVPTLRCNLACDYCQVSRATEGATGYDWSDATLQQTLAFLDDLETESIKVEFQGGEPLLRLDLLEKVRAFCRQRFASCTFVVCSNLQRVDDAAWAFFADEDTFLSTSIDGDISIQASQRTHDQAVAKSFFANLRSYIDRYGNDRLSALPTVDLRKPVDPNVLIDTYAGFGLRSIYLRPVNQQGFARRVAPGKSAAADWSAYHRRFIQALIARNYESNEAFEEFYLTHAIRRVMRGGADNHVDLRNPNILGVGYLVVDYDGALYPTDEARMMSRVGQIDLSIGHVATGLTRERIAELNASSFNDLDPDCQHCAFQPYCGTDVIDDISRYGRVDVPRGETWFCQRHTALFDLVFELLRSRDQKVIHSMKKWAGVETWPAYLSEVRA